LFSSTSGENKFGTPFAVLLKTAISEILITPLRLDKICSSLTTHLMRTSVRSCDIFPVATLAAQGLVAEFKKAGIAHVQVDKSIMNHTAGSESATGNMAHSKLAIIAYSGRYPGAQSNEAFWELLEQGRDVASKAPRTRWDTNTQIDPTGKKKNTSATPWGCWLQYPGLFDARFFNMSPREAPQADPAQRLSLLTAYEAIENAGLVPDATPSTQRDRVGVFYGATSNDWGETNSSQNIDTYNIPGLRRAFIPGRQKFFFKFSGPSYSVDTACSSSLAAMHVACNALWRGDIDTAITGGTNITTNPDITAGLDRGHFLSRTGNCEHYLSQIIQGTPTSQKQAKLLTMTQMDTAEARASLLSSSNVTKTQWRTMTLSLPASCLLTRITLPKQRASPVLMSALSAKSSRKC